MNDTTLATGITPERLAGLRKWNLGQAVLHAAQAVVVILLASDFAITVTSTYPQGPPGTRLTTPEGLFDVAIGPAIAVFLALAAFERALIVDPSLTDLNRRVEVLRFRNVQDVIDAAQTAAKAGRLDDARRFGEA